MRPDDSAKEKKSDDSAKKTEKIEIVWPKRQPSPFDPNPEEAVRRKEALRNQETISSRLSGKDTEYFASHTPINKKREFDSLIEMIAQNKKALMAKETFQKWAKSTQAQIKSHIGDMIRR